MLHLHSRFEDDTSPPEDDTSPPDPGLHMHQGSYRPLNPR
jgi:hypothetical protein